MFDIESVAARIEDWTGTVVSDLEREAHTKIGLILVNTVHELVGILPEGEVVNIIAATLGNVASMAHDAVHHAAAAADPQPAAQPAEPAVAQSAPAEPTAEPSAETATEPAA